MSCGLSLWISSNVTTNLLIAGIHFFSPALVYSLFLLFVWHFHTSVPHNDEVHNFRFCLASASHPHVSNTNVFQCYFKVQCCAFQFSSSSFSHSGFVLTVILSITVIWSMSSWWLVSAPVLIRLMFGSLDIIWIFFMASLLLKLSSLLLCFLSRERYISFAPS